MRCNRMTLTVKHYSNSGGACSNRDKKGKEERVASAEYLLSEGMHAGSTHGQIWPL